jgi:hypothetical protein
VFGGYSFIDRNEYAVDRPVPATKEGTVPLSDHEQRLLDEIEQALYAEDPKFAASVRLARTRSRTRRSAILCGLGVIAGLALVLVGLVTNVIVLSVIGFVFVVAACGYAVQLVRGRGRGTTTSSPATPSRAPRQGGGFKGRMEERLRRRFEDES